jgi:hypothetical protein
MITTKEIQMIIKDFKCAIDKNPDMKMHFMLPDNSFVPSHYHITEIGRVHKDFIDCGGTIRSTEACVLQIWVANDFDHRLHTTKLSAIMQAANSLFNSDTLPVEVEYEGETISQYPISGFEITPCGLLFYLGTKHTACLAPEKCNVTGTGCC